MPVHFPILDDVEANALTTFWHPGDSWLNSLLTVGPAAQQQSAIISNNASVVNKGRNDNDLIERIPNCEGPYRQRSAAFKG